MAGHSKWANIQHRKTAQDAKRGKIFTRLIRAIKVAARQGGGDPDSNAALRNAMETARAANMTKDVVERAIKQGIGDTTAETVEELTYEGYGPGGVAILVEAMTDNRNRTASDIRHVFTKYGGNLGAAGSVAYLFNKQGILTFPAGTDEDRLMETALEAGADDLRSDSDGTFTVVTSVDAFSRVKVALEQHKFEPNYSAVMMVAAIDVEVTGEDAEKLVKLLEKLEELDDVQEVYSNANISDDVLAKL
jgi:YebC/PmpR family DNA-binding regulatory protein